MKIKITFRSMEHSVAIEEFAKEKLSKLNKFFKHDNSDIISYNLTLEAHKIHNFFISELHVTSSHYNLITQAEEKDMYKSIEKVIQKMNTEINKKKEKQIDSIKETKKHF